MKIGIIPNTTKANVAEVVYDLISKLDKHGFSYLLCESLKGFPSAEKYNFSDDKFCDTATLCSQCDFVVSIGGDGTVLNTAFEVRKYDTPIIGVNFGKLGFLAEYEINNIDQLLEDIKEGDYIIQERIAIEAVCNAAPEDKLYAINDFVIDKGRWPKMIEIQIEVDGEMVSEFVADGIIVATPTGSTGYSLSTGGPIISPSAGAIALSPISPHTLNMRPLVLSSEQEIRITVNSHASVQINSDGQRVNFYKPPIVVDIKKSEKGVKLLHSKRISYFDILRKKLFWGLDVRSINNKRIDESK